MNNLIVSMIGQDCEKHLKMCLNSVKNIASDIVFIDGGSKDKTISLIKQWCKDNKIKSHIIESEYKHEHKHANGYQRNIYLKYIQKHFNKKWCLVLDPDEVLSDNAEELIKDIPAFEENKINVVSIKMRHIIGDFGHEDYTLQEHIVTNRLFKINENLYYDEVEHPILKSKKDYVHAIYKKITVWHLAYGMNYMFEIKKRYLNHLKKSNIHSSDFLQWWYYAHITGGYARKPFNITELPKPVKEEYLIEDDYFYFINRDKLELKHVLDAYHWKEYFKPKTALDIGCGFGQRVWALLSYGVDAEGYEISQFAVDKSMVPIKIKQQDITELPDYYKTYDLVICYDLLEHLEEKDLDKTLKNIYLLGNKDFVFSIPFEGDPNLLADITHKIFKDASWWYEKLSNNGFKIEKTPEHFLFKNQIIIAKK